MIKVSEKERTLLQSFANTFEEQVDATSTQQLAFPNLLDCMDEISHHNLQFANELPPYTNTTTSIDNLSSLLS